MAMDKKNKKVQLSFFIVFFAVFVVVFSVFFSHNYKNSNLVDEVKAAAVTNVMLNSGFESGTASWSAYFGTAFGSGSFTALPPGFEGTNAGKFAIGTLGDNVQFYQVGFPLVANSYYKLSFSAYSSNGNNVSLDLFKHASPYTGYGIPQYTIDLSTAWQTFTKEFTTVGFSGTVTDARLRFWFLGAGNAVSGTTYYFDNFVLEKIGDIVITTQPANQTVLVGATATFSVTATGTTLAYQWQKNGVDIVGATLASYTTPATVYTDNSAIYRVVITNATGGTTSNSATLTVNASPTITTNPSSQTVSDGATATFNVVATGTAPLAYQWKKNGANIAGATNASYTTPALVLADDGATFSVYVSNAFGNVTSSSATLTVAPNSPAITTQPLNTTVLMGATATFTVVATGTTPLAYQWKKNGADIVGATNASYTTPVTIAADNGAAFSVVITNIASSVTSNSATLTVNIPPSITTQPINQSIYEREGVTFTVVVAGTAPLAYQWKKNGVNIAGATSASYNIPATVLVDNGATFSVYVSNAYGNVTSSSATMEVLYNSNAIFNSGFESGTNFWAYVNIGGSGSFTMMTSGQKTGVNSAQVYIGAAGTNIQLMQSGFAIEANKQYRASFSAYSSTGRNMHLSLIRHSDGYNFGLYEDYDLTTGWQTFSTDFVTSGFAGTTNDTTNVARLMFRFSGFALGNDYYYIDDVKLEKIGDIYITTQPANFKVNELSQKIDDSNQAIGEGYSATFSVVATGTAPLAYQWQKNGVNIFGATNSTYIIPSATVADNGAYRVIISNDGGKASLWSESLTLTVVPFVQVDANMFGFAWSGNIGWISFNSKNCDTNIDGRSDASIAGCPPVGSFVQGYGVNLNADNTLSGYAWSPNIGWISFNRSDTGVPPGAPYNGAETYIAKLDGSNNLTGWAKVTSTGGTWDGWIKLSKDSSDGGPAYGVRLNVAQFSGYAWGNNVVLGWVSFNCSDRGVCGTGVGQSNYKVYLTGITTADNFSVAPVAYCSKPPTVTFGWDYVSGTLSQDQYQIQIATDSLYSTIVLDRTVSQVVLPNNQESMVLQIVTAPVVNTSIGYSTAYYWRVKVHNTAGWSDWAEYTDYGNSDGDGDPKTFRTKTQAPDVDFSPTLPTSLITNFAVQFCADNDITECSTNTIHRTACYDASNVKIACSSFNWDFGDCATAPATCTSIIKNPTHQYATSTSPFNVSLTVGDGVRTCSSSSMLGVVKPKWIEVIPVN